MVIHLPRLCELFAGVFSRSPPDRSVFSESVTTSVNRQSAVCFRLLKGLKETKRRTKGLYKEPVYKMNKDN